MISWNGAGKAGRRVPWILEALAAGAMIACTNAGPPAKQVPIVIPFELRGDFALVTAEVNGQPALLIVDTGSGVSTLDSAFARVAEVEINGPRALVAGTTERTMQLGTARSIRVGSAVLTRPLTAAVDFGPVQSRIGYDVRGSIGFELFAKYVVAVDYAARTLTLYDPATFVYSGSGVVLPLTLAHRVPVVDGSILTRRKGTLKARLHLDLGSSTYALRLATRFVTEHDLERDTVTVAGPFGAGVGGVTIGSLLRFPRLTLGDLVIERPSTALSHEVGGALSAAASADGAVGAPVFRRTRLIVDYAHSRAIIEPHGRFDVPDSVDASGLSLTMEPEPTRALLVSYVVAGSAGAEAGIHVGDELLRIDDQSVASLTIAHAKDLLRAAGTTRHLTLRRGNEAWGASVSLRAVF